MKNIKLVLVLAIALCFSADIEAQTYLDKIAKKIEKKAADRLERKVDKKIDQGLDKTEETIDETGSRRSDRTPSEPNMDNASGNDYGGFLSMSNVNVDDKYAFGYKLTYNITLVSEAETNEMDIEVSAPKDVNDSYSYFKTKNISQMEDNEALKDVFIIFDAGNSAMITVMENKQYLAMKYDPSKINQKMEEDDQNVSIQKTGKTKTILGYECVEYAMDSEDSRGNMWVSDDPALQGCNPFGGMAQSMKNSNVNFSDVHIAGAMLEMNMEMKDVKKKKDVRTMKYLVTSIDKEDLNIDMSKYQNMLIPQR